MQDKTGIFRLLVAVAAIFSATVSASAQYGQWRFGVGDDGLSYRISTAADGDLISCGNRIVTRHDGGTMLVEWTTTVSDFLPYAVIETLDGGIAAAGAHLIDNTVQTMLVKYDGMGNLQWHQVYPGYHVYEMIDLIESRNGGFLIAGEVINPDAFTQRPFLIKTKPEGDIEWMHRYDLNVSDTTGGGEFSSVEEEVDSDGTIRYHLTGRYKDTQLGKYDTLVMTVDSGGGVLGAAMVGFDNHTDFGRGLIRYGNGFLVTGYSKEFGEGGGTYLMSMSNDFTLVNWYCGVYGFTGTKEIQDNMDGLAVLVGTASYPNPVENAAMLALKTASPGNLAWGMQYGGQASDTGTDFTLESTGYALLGNTRSFAMPNNDHYVVRTDFNGVSGCLEIPYTPDVQLQSMKSHLREFNVVPVEGVEPVEVEWTFVETDQEDLCDDPADPCECVYPPEQMQAWWTFDELMGPIAAESIAGNDGNYVGNPMPAMGKVAYGLDFDGFDDFVEVPDDVLLNVTGSQGEGIYNFTIDSWIRLDGANPVAWGPIMEKRDLATQAGYAFYVRDGRLECSIGDGIVTQTFTSANMVPHGTWAHVAVIVNRSSGVTRFMIDGVEEISPQSPNIGTSLSTSASVWLGGMRSTSGAGSDRAFLDGMLDEVEFFGRALDTSEIQGIYNAQECGKCKINCHVEWDIPFCLNDAFVDTAVTVCNDSPVPATIELNFNGLAAGLCGDIDGPTVFTVLAPSNPVLVPGNSCMPVIVRINRPATMVSVHNLGCFEVLLTNLDNGTTNKCLGSVIDRRDLCPDVPIGGDLDIPIDIWVDPPVTVDVGVTIVNTGFQFPVIDWRAVAYDPNMEPSSNISVNGMEPGMMAGGEVKTPPAGEIVTVSLGIKAEQFESGISDVVLFTVIPGGSGPFIVPLTSFAVRTSFGGEAPCQGDFNGDGEVSGGDLGLMLSAWGPCSGCPEDLNGDGVVNGGDLGLLLSLWGECP